LHHVFDKRRQKNYPSIPFKRFANDAICHFKSKAQALMLKEAIRQRFAQCGLELHSVKTKIVYCKGDDRKGTYPEQKFDFLRLLLVPEGRKTDGVRTLSISAQQ